MSETATLLVVDDEPELREILSEYFDNQGLIVHTAASAEEARAVFSKKLPDVAILDIRMPGEDGLSLARWIRDQHKDMGIIMLTTAGDVVDRVVGLEMGADDYVPKPFDLRELLARVKSVLRRRSETSKENKPTREGRMHFGICELDLAMHRLYDSEGNEKPITAMEFDLLKVFAEHPNRALNRDQLMELAHNKDWGVFDRSIDLRIMRLRRKIEPNPEKPEVIKTVRGIGYMYVTS
ncbi:MAG: response regulator [Candidatus Thiodiazotropha sp. (ex. Lucinisca nassula)]|nr:response regulator [Candidatus Thiodiazotropha sp. (ex. Lucinisca nassula)]MBW9261480.1 response regulator [Candidatus Thiodiazotropha sp. (ex. Lucinisca nassula)]MBW9268715.1 response regulator [Candidatus Thiodiazotropha sp. (ex. Lucinisca nassula)]